MANQPLAMNDPYNAVYDIELGFEMHVDYISRLNRTQWNQVKIESAVFNRREMVARNKKFGPSIISPDTYSITHDKVFFGSSITVKMVPQNPEWNLIIEIQGKGLEQYEALGWTLINLFEGSNCNLNRGCFKLPLYQQPTVPELSIHNISSLVPANGFLMMKIAISGDKFSNSDPNMHDSGYAIPKWHLVGNRYNQYNNQKAEIINPNNQPVRRNNFSRQVPSYGAPLMKDSNYENPLVKDPNYVSNGLLVYLHYFRNLDPKNMAKIYIQTTVTYNGMVVRTNDNQEMVWKSRMIKTK